ncbi:MAG: hypothetical protein ACOYVD_15380 [Bacillota bacterium]
MPSRAIIIMGFFIALIVGGAASWWTSNSGVWFYFWGVLWFCISFTAINLGIFLFGSKLFEFSYQDENNLIIPIRLGILVISIMILFKYITI